MRKSYNSRRTPHHNRHRLSAAIALVASTSYGGVPSLAWSQEARTFEKVRVTATRMDTTTEEVNRSVAVIEREQLETLQPQSIAETIRFEPNVTPFGGPRKNQQTINIRGLTEEKILQTVDGVRQDFNSGHRPQYFLDPVLLKSVEVVKGPASALWGSGALGGVVAQTTLSAKDLLQPEQNLGGLVRSTFNFNNRQSTNTAALAGRTETLDWLVSGYFRDSDDLKQGNGQRLLDSGFRDGGGLFKVDWQLDEHQSLGINFRQAESNGNIPNNGADTATTSNFVVGRRLRTNTLAINYAIDTPSPWINTNAVIYRNTVDAAETRVTDGRADDTEQETFGFQLTNQSTWGRLNLLYGVDGDRDDFSGVRSGPNRPRPPEAKTQVMGVFTQATLELHPKWQLEMGGLPDDFKTEEQSLGSHQDSALSPSVALSYRPTEWLQTTLRHDRAFRAPNAEELFSTGTHFCGGPLCNTFVPNPNLRPEQAANTELLAKMHFQNVFSTDELKLTASVFENQVDNFIEQIVTGPTAFGPRGPLNLGISTFQNVDQATLKGYEIGTQYHRKGLQASFAYGQVRGKEDASGRALANIPADTLTADMSYAFSSEQLRVGARVLQAAGQSRKPLTDPNDYEGYTVGDLYATWKPQAFQALTLGLNINNVTDQNYRRAFSQLFEAGREIITSVRYDF